MLSGMLPGEKGIQQQTEHLDEQLETTGAD